MLSPLVVPLGPSEGGSGIDVRFPGFGGQERRPGFGEPPTGVGLGVGMTHAICGGPWVVRSKLKKEGFLSIGKPSPLTCPTISRCLPFSLSAERCSMSFSKCCSYRRMADGDEGVGLPPSAPGKGTGWKKRKRELSTLAMVFRVSYRGCLLAGNLIVADEHTITR